MKCYKLDKEYTHSGDLEKDAFCIPFDGIDDFGSNMMDIDNFDIPSRLYFTANFQLIPKYDYPLTDLTAPVMSKRMLEVLLGIKEFKYKCVPAVMIDDLYLENQFDESGNLKEDVPFNEDYYAVQLKEYSEVFDRENSEYQKSLIFPDKVGAIEKMVLKEPEEGFPSLFRIKESRRHLFLSQEAKEALDAAGIKGCVLEEVEVSN